MLNQPECIAVFNSFLFTLARELFTELSDTLFGASTIQKTPQQPATVKYQLYMRIEYLQDLNRVYSVAAKGEVEGSFDHSNATVGVMKTNFD